MTQNRISGRDTEMKVRQQKMAAALLRCRNILTKGRTIEAIAFAGIRTDLRQFRRLH